MAHDPSSKENNEELCLIPSLDWFSLDLLGQETCRNTIQSISSVVAVVVDMLTLILPFAAIQI